MITNAKKKDSSLNTLCCDTEIQSLSPQNFRYQDRTNRFNRPSYQLRKAKNESSSYVRRGYSPPRLMPYTSEILFYFMVGEKLFRFFILENYSSYPNRFGKKKYFSRNFVLDEFHWIKIYGCRSVATRCHCSQKGNYILCLYVSSLQFLLARGDSHLPVQARLFLQKGFFIL